MFSLFNDNLSLFKIITSHSAAAASAAGSAAAASAAGGKYSWRDMLSCLFDNVSSGFLIFIVYYVRST